MGSLRVRFLDIFGVFFGVRNFEWIVRFDSKILRRVFVFDVFD